jgi:hypothetical protein
MKIFFLHFLSLSAIWLRTVRSQHSHFSTFEYGFQNKFQMYLEVNRHIVLEERGIPILLRVLTTHKNVKLATALVETLTFFARDSISPFFSFSLIHYFCDIQRI